MGKEAFPRWLTCGGCGRDMSIGTDRCGHCKTSNTQCSKPQDPVKEARKQLKAAKKHLAAVEAARVAENKRVKEAKRFQKRSVKDHEKAKRVKAKNNQIALDALRRVANGEGGEAAVSAARELAAFVPFNPSR